MDERIVGFKPKSLSLAEAAALTLTTFTAYEAFFDRLGIDHDGTDKEQSASKQGRQEARSSFSPFEIDAVLAS